MLLADLFVLGGDPFGVGLLAALAHEVLDHADRAGGVFHVDYRLFVAGGYLYRRVRLGRCGAPDQ